MSSYAIQIRGKYYLTVAFEGGVENANVAIRTNAKTVGTNELFMLIAVDLERNLFALRTAKGNIVTFVNNGGKGGTNTINCPLHTDATWINVCEILQLIPQPDGKYAVQTPKGFYLSAANGGGWGEGANLQPVHTDATWIQEWETFRLVKLA